VTGDIQVWLETQINAVANGAFRNAKNSRINQMDALNTYLEKGWLKMDNNDSEQCIRPIALGR